MLIVVLPSLAGPPGGDRKSLGIGGQAAGYSSTPRRNVRTLSSLLGIPIPGQRHVRYCRKAPYACEAITTTIGRIAPARIALPMLRRADPLQGNGNVYTYSHG